MRTMQMMLGHALLLVEHGREWRFEAARDLAPDSAYLQIISCFLDRLDAPLSLQNFVKSGQERLGKAPSSWLGPTTSAQTAGHLVRQANLCSAAAASTPACLKKVACAVFDDGAIFKADVMEAFQQDEAVEGVVILVCKVLGLDRFNEAEYREAIKSCFEMPQFLGLASGNDGTSAHYFIATHGDEELLFLDPHTVHPALHSIEEVMDAGVAETLRPPQDPLRLGWSRLNASMCLGFLVRSHEDFETLCASLCEGARGEVFEVLEKKPCYDAASYSLIIDEEDEFAVIG